ncbi:uncharacterized protein [Medicago truncatula]|uniref:uncharacterized protein isoform X2 n=1 Tax=Medicago truncatula TaxID=3880 RepID=UPI00196845C4|nr:uncharacterized protein LOC25483791 isoform X2 [Medicago truncatula]
MENNDLFPAKKQEAEETKFISEEKPPPPVTTKVAKMEYTDWSPLLKENCEKYLAKQKEEDRKYFSEFLRNKLKRPAVKTNVADNHTPAVTSGTLFVISDPFLAEITKRLEEESLETTYPVCNPFAAKKEKESKFVMTKPLVAEKCPVTSDSLFVMSDPLLAERVAKRVEEEGPLETTNLVCNPFPAVKTNIADNHTLPFPKLLPNEGLKVDSYEGGPFGTFFNNEKMKSKLCCCQSSKMSLNFNSLLDAKQLEVEVAKMEYTDWSPFLKENCERYLAKKKEEDRKYFSEFLRNKLKRPAVKTNVADNHSPAVTSGTLFVMSDPFLAERFTKRLEEESLETTNPVCNPFAAKKEKESKFVMTKPLVAEKRPLTSDSLFVMSDPFLAERVAKRQKVESLEEELLETTNPVCNPFPAKKEKESKFVRTKPRVAEKHPVMSDPFLAERPPHMFLNIFFAYKQKVEELAEVLKIESMEGEPQVTPDPLVAKKHHVSTMFLNLFLAYKQEVEGVAKMLKKDSIDGEPFLTTDPILAEKPPVLAYQQEVESSKKKEEESNTTNIAEKHTLTYFDDKPVSQPASSSDTAT